MRFQVPLFVLYAALGVASAAKLRRDETTWQEDVLHDLVNRPDLLTPNGRKLLEYQMKGSKKRSPQDQTLNAFLGSSLGVISNIGIPTPASKVPETQYLQAEDPTPGAKRVKVRYGPYRLPALSAKNNLESRLLGTVGMSNTMKLGAKKPCRGECLILTVSAALEYADGNLAPNADGAWFHHSVLMNSGPNVTDLVCATDKPGRVETVFQSGNEKSLNAFTLAGAAMKSGYHVRPSDVFILNIELMNMEDKENWVWLAISFDYLESSHPEYDQYKEGKLLWLNLGPARCGGKTPNPFGTPNITSHRLPTKLEFSEHSVPWMAGFSGQILATNGHMHDGGTGVEVFKNTDMICKTVPFYSNGPNTGMGAHSRRQIKPPVITNPMEFEHIAGQKPCIFEKAIPIRKGDTMYVKASYDFNQHQGMVTKEGYLDEVMGTVGVLVAVD